VHRSALVRIRSGERQVSAGTIRRACEALHLKPEYFERDSGSYYEFLDTSHEGLFTGELGVVAGIAGTVRHDSASVEIVRAARDLVRQMGDGWHDRSKVRPDTKKRAERARGLAHMVTNWKIVRMASEIEHGAPDARAAELGDLLALFIVSEFLLVLGVDDERFVDPDLDDDEDPGGADQTP
jgi:transcriptional regulator with XRE-family HTH domain